MNKLTNPPSLTPVQPSNEPELCKLESGIPVGGKGISAEINLIKAKVLVLATQAEVKQSFVVPKSQRATIRNYLIDELPERKFRNALIKDNPGFVRFWRTQ